MTRIIDRTLACIEVYEPGEKILRQLAALLFSSGADFLEVSAPEYESLGGAAPNAQYILRIKELQDAEKYASCKDIKRFVCANKSDMGHRVYAEIRINDMRDFFTIVHYKDSSRVRVCGLADAILQPVDTLLNNLRSTFSGTIELSPENDCHSATSIAVEWALIGGSNVVTSFFGMDNMAAFEDVTRALNFLKGRKAKFGLEALDRLDGLLRELLMGCECP
ncbi:MAG: hypothetical protein AB7C97_08570 [Oscillospiraceae bacterium]